MADCYDPVFREDIEDSCPSEVTHEGQEDTTEPEIIQDAQT